MPLSKVRARDSRPFGDGEIEKQREAGRDRLVIRIETGSSAGEWSAIASRLEKKIMSVRPALGDFIKKGTVWPLSIELVKPGTLPRNPKTGKLIRVVDYKGV